MKIQIEFKCGGQGQSWYSAQCSKLRSLDILRLTFSVNVTIFVTVTVNIGMVLSGIILDSFVTA